MNFTFNAILFAGLIAGAQSMSLRGHARSDQTSVQSTPSNSVHRQLTFQLEQDEDDDCTAFNDYYMEYLRNQAEQYSPEAWVSYICSEVTNEMIFKPAMENPEQLITGKYSSCAMGLLEESIVDLQNLGMDISEDGGFAHNQALCETLMMEGFGSLASSPDGRRLEPISVTILLASLVIITGFTVSIGAFAGIGVGFAAIGGAFEDEFYISHPTTNLVWEVSGCNDGDRIQLAEIDPRDFQGLSDHQRFRAGENNEIISVLCEKPIDVERASCDSGSEIRIWRSNGSRAQQFLQGENGELAPDLECDEPRTIGIEHGDFNIGAGLVLEAYGGGPSQIFNLHNARTYNGGEVRNTTPPRQQDRLEEVSRASICNVGTGNCLYASSVYSVGPSGDRSTEWEVETVEPELFRFNAGPGLLGANEFDQIFLADQTDEYLFQYYLDNPRRLQWRLQGTPCPASASSSAICGRLVSRAYGKALEDGVVGGSPRVTIQSVRGIDEQIWVID